MDSFVNLTKTPLSNNLNIIKYFYKSAGFKTITLKMLLKRRFLPQLILIILDGKWSLNPWQLTNLFTGLKFPRYG